VDQALGLVDPAFGSQFFLRFFFQAGPHFEAAGSAALLEGLSAGAGDGQRPDSDDEHCAEHGGHAEETQEAVGRTGGGFGRHISWTI